MCNETLNNMDKILGFSKIANDVVIEFKTKINSANTEAEVDALYAEYKNQLKWATNQEDWEALVNAKKNQIRNFAAANDAPALEYTLSYLVEIANALDSYGFINVANIIDNTINKIKNGGYKNDKP